MRYLLCILFLTCMSCQAQHDAEVKGLLKQALAYEDNGNIDEAIKTHQKITALQPGNYASLNAIAGLYGKQGQFADEVVWAQKAVQANSQFSMGYINLGNGYAGQGDTARAKENYLLAEKYDPESAYAQYSLGVLQENAGNLQQAIVYYKNSVLRDTAFENGYYNLAAAYANLKNFKNADTCIRKVLQLHPGAEDALEMQQHISAELKH